MCATGLRIWIVLVSLTLIATSVRAQQVPEPRQSALSMRVELLHERLRNDADHSRVSRLHVQGVGVVLLGALASSLGAYLLLDGAGMGQTTTRALASAPLFTYGLLYSMAGVRLLVADETFAEHRVHRFDALRARGALAERDVAHFEAELYMSAWNGRDRRITNGFSAIGMGVAGLGLLAFALSGALDDDALGVTATLGVTYTTLGIWQSIALLTGESNEEKYWRRYVDAVNAMQSSYATR